MNYFVPVQLGAPDKQIKTFYVSSIKSIANSYLSPQLLILEKKRSYALGGVREALQAKANLSPYLRSLLSTLVSRDKEVITEANLSKLKRENVQSNLLLKDKTKLSNLNIERLGPYLAGL
jgi:hypothetical protein